MRRQFSLRATVLIAVTLWSLLFWLGVFTVIAGGV